MAERKPLVLDSSANLQQLQGKDDLDIPLADRVEVLEKRFNQLILWLADQGFELPPELFEDI